MPRPVQISEDVRSVLMNAVFSTDLDGRHAVKLVGQLDRQLYERVNEVMVAAGGKWNRGAKVHLFEANPREVLCGAVKKGSIVDKKKALGQFFTLPELAVYVMRRARLRAGDRILEPSAGGGALAMGCRELYGATVSCVEIDERHARTLVDRGFETYRDDFLTMVPGDEGLHDFDAVVMNPPFLGNVGVRHVLHAFKFLRPGGRLVAILPAGAQTGRTKLHKQLRALGDASYETTGRPWCEELPEGSFKDAGTDVRVVLVEITKGVVP